jgi:cold shock CspA family protein
MEKVCMPRAMMFIDGTWLYSSRSLLAESYGARGFEIDFGHLPRVIADAVGRQLGSTEIEVVRTCLFGSYASNYDLRDDDAVQRRLGFFRMLREEYHYELEIYPINYFGRRLRKTDRDAADAFEPREKCVDISLATTMLYFAAIPHAYDIAITVLGDRDFMPVLQHVRRLGKRVAIASVRGSCAPVFADPSDEARLKDFDIIWLDDLLQDLELKYEKHRLECQSPTHKGDLAVWTTFWPRKGQKFYCEECRNGFAKQKAQAQEEFLSAVADDVISMYGNGAQNGLIGMNNGMNGTNRIGEVQLGIIKNIVSERGFGFIKSADLREYFFHLTDLEQGLGLEELEPGQRVGFEVKRMPVNGKAGAAQNVRRH